MASIDNSSDQIDDNTCDTCLRERHVSVESVKFCLDCKEHFCSSCLKFHQQFSITKSHVTVDPKRPRAVAVDIGITDKTRPQVPGLALGYSEDGSKKYYVLSDWFNRRVKLFDMNFKMIDELQLKEKPYALAFLERSREIAVTLRDYGEVAILKISSDGKLLLVKKLTVAKNCRGMVTVKGLHSDMIFLVSGGNKKENEKAGECHMYSYGMNKDLSLLRTFQTDFACINVFPRNVVTNATGDVICVSTDMVGIIVYDMRDISGSAIRAIVDPRLERARGLTIDRHGYIYVAGMASSNVLKFDPSGKVMDEVLTKRDGLVTPISLYYDDTTDRLLVGGSSVRDQLYYLQM